MSQYKQNSTVVFGTFSDDNLQLSYDNAKLKVWILTFNGDDSIELTGTLRNSAIFTGRGNDSFFLDAQMNNLYLSLGKGDDRAEIRGNLKDAVIFSGSGNDEVIVEAIGDDLEVFTGSGEDNIVIGWEGNSESYHNSVYVDAGNDDDTIVLLGSSTLVDSRFIDGGDGVDSADYFNADQNIKLDLVKQWRNDGAAINDYLLNIENITGTRFDDIILGNAKDNLLIGVNGNDVLKGRGGDDIIRGDFRSTNLNLIAEDGNGIFISGIDIASFGDDQINGGRGNDKLYGDIAETWRLGLKGADNSSQGDGSVFLLDFTYTFGDDTLIDKFGHNLIVGDATDYELEVLAGNAINSNDFFDFSAQLEQADINFGSDMIHTGYGNDEIYGDVSTSTITVQSGSDISGFSGAEAGLRAVVHFFGNDNIQSLGGNNKIIGDVGYSNISLATGDRNSNEASTSVSIGLGFNFDTFEEVGTSWQYGDDIIVAGNGNNKVYGDGIEALVNVRLGSNNTVSQFASISSSAQTSFFTGLEINTPLYQFGNDTITLGHGDNKVYADVELYKLTLSMGDDNVIDSSSIRIEDTQVIFGNDNVQLAGGKSLIIGDASRVEYDLSDWGSGNEVLGSFDATLSNNSNIQFGDDFLNARHSDEVRIFGDIRDWNTTLNSGENNILREGANYSIFLSSSTFFHIWGNDNLIGSNNVHSINKIWGDFKNITIDLLGSRNETEAFVNSTTVHNAAMRMGDDSITVSGGYKNTLMGDGQNVSISVQAGDGLSNSPTQVFLPFMGFDSIEVGMIFASNYVNPNDVIQRLYGDVKNYDISISGGNDTGGNGILFSSFRSNAINIPDAPLKAFGDDTVVNHWGKAKIYGDAQFFNVVVNGANNTTTDSINDSVITFGGGESFVFGDDSLVSDSPTNDVVYGEGVTFNVSVNGGIASNEHLASAEINLSELVFGGDILDAGSGDDLVYGDWETASVSLVDGQNIDGSSAYAGADIFVDTIRYLQDVFISGAGNDTYIGDGDFNYLHFDESGNEVFDAPFVIFEGNLIDFSNDPGAIHVDLENEIATDGWGDTDTLIQFTSVIGSGFADTIMGNDVENTITGNAGNDLLFAGNGFDTLDYSQEIGFQGVTISVKDGIASDTYGDTDLFFSFERFIGSEFNDIITGGNDSLEIESLGGNDFIQIGNGDNIISSGDGDDTIITGNGNNQIDTGAGNNTVVTGAGFDFISSGSGNNIVTSGEGDDSIAHRGGIDKIDAGLGFDSFLAETNYDLKVVDSTLFAAAAAMGLQTVATNIESIEGNGFDSSIDLSDLSSDMLINQFGGFNQTELGTGRLVYSDFGDGYDIISSTQTTNSELIVQQVEEIHLGTGDDHITVTGPLSTSFIDAGAGIDTIDYSQASEGVVVDLDKTLVVPAVVSTIEAVIGADPGEGLDLMGVFDYAFDAVGVFGPLSVYDVNFEPTEFFQENPQPGFSHNYPFGEFSQDLFSFYILDDRTSPQDNDLGAIYSGVSLYGSFSDPYELSLDVVRGETYSLQIMLGSLDFGGGPENLTLQSVTIEGQEQLLAPEAFPVAQGLDGELTEGLVIRHDFVALDASLDISIIAENDFGEIFVPITAITLENLLTPVDLPTHDLNNIENIIGSEFDDLIFGSSTDNRLEGDLGNDQLSGLAGSDVFVMNNGDGQDVILDFEDGIDIIDVIDYGFSDISEFNSITQEGMNTLVNFNGTDSVELLDFDMAMISNADFAFA